MPIIPGRRPGQWKAYYWCRTDKKQKWVPAEVTSLWEGLDFDAAASAFEAWTESGGIARVRSRRRSVLQADELKSLINDFIEEAALLSPDTSANTLKTVQSQLLTYVTSYFVLHHLEKNVRNWWQHTGGFTRWLRETYPHLSVGTVKKVGQSLRRFGEYLVEEGVIRQPWRIKKVRRAKGETRSTPLPRELLPQEVLAVAARLEPLDALPILLGYFCSLRPGETFGLDKEDFVTGLKAKQDAKTYERLAKLGLGSGLSVAVNKVRTLKGTSRRLKTGGSLGVVNCWSVEGAKAISRLVKGLESGPIFQTTSRAALNKAYKENGMPLLGMFLYDLRRASGLYLGRTMGADIFLLQDHLRHAAISTTLLYTRRPTTEREGTDSQDFDDVG